MKPFKRSILKRLNISLSLAVLIGGILVGGCGTKTTVVVLPEPDGSVGQVTVSSKDNTMEVLNNAYETASVGAPGKPVQREGVMDPGTVKKIFKSVLAAQPEPPRVFILYFQSGKTELTPESKVLVLKILDSIQNRESRYISVVGHTDRVGNAAKNAQLARNRAGFLAGILLDKGVDKQLIEISSHGENNPLVPTADEVAEPRNRRVEVVVR